MKQIQTALISVFDKTGLEPIIREMHRLNIQMFSTGGTQKFIEDLGIPVTAVEEITSFPEILGGRVKTLHPKIFGGILNRRDHEGDRGHMAEHAIPHIDCVIVDLYPFEKTLASGASHEDIIEKIDIGGISLIRAGAKNFNDVVIIPSVFQYNTLLDVLKNNEGKTDLATRQKLAGQAFQVSSHYDSKIFSYFDQGALSALKISETESTPLRYGENPHQKGWFFGDLNGFFDQLNGKELSYNNLLDVDAAVALMDEFKNDNPTFAILKHNNACGIATRPTIQEAYEAALSCDPVSAFGGVLIANRTIDLGTAEKIHSLFCEVIIAPAFDQNAIDLLKGKTNRILLVQKQSRSKGIQVRSALNGVLVQEADAVMEGFDVMKSVTEKAVSPERMEDLIFANKIAKHTKSNTIVLAKNLQLIASGTGQTSRVDALKQAIEKAHAFQFDLTDSVMASDAFFPFPDCVEIAFNSGVRSVIQPGGSIKDDLSIAYCNQAGMAMVTTGVRHFKH
ncbi:MAG: bifunctional phosphoribosylaminoimidazolecarboxamide formyltransferase/IMP cyclohydrolase [Bacteroidota bacterium]|jgi:phosphoribosylaminoimidazolecarboxamide formyltransferase/IMP cyclohydrolase